MSQSRTLLVKPQHLAVRGRLGLGLDEEELFVGGGLIDRIDAVHREILQLGTQTNALSD